MNKKKIIIIGSTSAIAERCARLWLAEAPAEMLLVGRNPQKTEVVAADLRARSPESEITIAQVDFVDPIAIERIVEKMTEVKKIDIALIAHGSLPNQLECQESISKIKDELLINGISPVLFAEALAEKMQKADAGTLAIIGSVAGERGRKSNYVYGASKGLITRYVQGLQHRLANSKVKIVLIKPGPTDTPMTAHLKRQGTKLAAVEYVARDIVSGIRKGKKVIYTPRVWALIMMIIRHLPHFIFKRLDI